jgi:hypothetical protein
MTKKDKRLHRIFQSPKNVRFSDLDVILVEYGYERRQSGKGSSHYVYSHPEVDMLIVLVSHGKNDILPEYQVKKAIKSLKILLEDV